MATPKNQKERPNLLKEAMSESVTIIDNTSPLWGVMLTLQENMNLRIGTQIWKKYVNAAFWNYISTPINFTITLFTAMSAGQTGTQSNYLNQSQLFYILFVSFILSIINTFFKLKEKAIMNYDSLKKYQDFGADFEEIYFTNICNESGLYKRYYAYLDLQSKVNEYESTGSIEHVNYITELIYLAIKCCFANKMKRINFRQRFWVLDGRPKDGYTHNFYANIKNQYKHNFNYEKSVTFDGNKTAKLSNEEKNTFVVDMSSNMIVPKQRDNDEFNYLGAKMLESSNIIIYVPDEEEEEEKKEKEETNSVENMSTYDERMFNRVKSYYKEAITEKELVHFLTTEQYDAPVCEFVLSHYLQHLGMNEHVADIRAHTLMAEVRKP